MDKQIIQKYLNNFRRLFSPYLVKDVNFKTVVFPSNDGAIIEIIFSKFSPAKDEFRKSEIKLSDSLKRIEQHAFGGNLDGFHFVGTNYLLENEKIFIIKDNNSLEWTAKKAQEDVFKLLNPKKH